MLSQLNADSKYVTLLLPAMIIMAIGLALIFVPITLTAVARVDTRTPASRRRC